MENHIDQILTVCGFIITTIVGNSTTNVGIMTTYVGNMTTCVGNLQTFYNANDQQ